MNAPHTDRVGAIAEELGRLGRRLHELGFELKGLGAAAEPVADGAPERADGTEQAEAHPPQPPTPHQGAFEPPQVPGHPATTPYSGSSGLPPYPTPSFAGVPGPNFGPPPVSYPGVPGQGQYPAPPGPYPGALAPPSYPGAFGPTPNTGAADPGPYWGAAGPYAGPAGPGPYPGPPGGAPSPYPTPGGRERRPVRTWLASLSGARLLAWTGAGVTLLGVVLLLALAAARGWFAPPVRVSAGAVFGLLLVGVAVWLHRRPTARVGALAVAGTGIATLYLVVAAATALYGFLPVPVGLLLALLVAAAGLGLADRWRSALLGSGTVVGAALLAPVVMERVAPLLVALVLVLQAAATVVALRRSWPVLAGVAAAWPVLYGTVVAGLTERTDRVGTIAASAAVLVLGVAGAAWSGRRATADRADPDATDSDGADPDGADPDGANPDGVDSNTADTNAADVADAALPRGLRIGLVVAAPFPALTFAVSAGGGVGAALAFVAAVLLFATAALPGRDHVLRVVALAAGAVALFVGTVIALDGDSQTAVLLGQGVVLLTVAAALRARVVLAVGGAFATLGVLTALGVQVPPSALASFPSAPFVLGTTPDRAALLAAVTMSVLILAAAVTALVASARVGLLGADARAAGLWVPVGLLGLYGAAGLVIAVALLVSTTRSGFVAGHAAVTVLWTAVAMVLLARGIRRPALRVAGLVLVAAAVAKLVLFDLVALDGLARVAAFLGAGLLLLAAGTRYARLVAEAEAQPVTDPAPQAGTRS